MNNELNTEHYQALQRAFDTDGWDRSVNLFFWKRTFYVCKFFRAMVRRITSLQAFGFEVLRHGSHSVKHFSSMAAFLWFLRQAAALAMQH